MKRMTWTAVCVSLVVAFMTSNAYNEAMLLEPFAAMPQNNLSNSISAPVLIDKINKRAEGKTEIDWRGGPEGRCFGAVVTYESTIGN